MTSLLTRRASALRSSRWGAWCWLALGASCGGTAFHVEEDPSGGGSAAGGGGGHSGAGGTAGAAASAGEAGGVSTPASPNEAGAPSLGGAGGEAGSGPAAEVSPISKAQLVYWFKADAGVTETSGRIARWADQSGNAHHAVQALESQQPRLTKTDLLPEPVVELDGDTFLELLPIDAAIDRGLTFFAVAGRSEDSPCSAIVELSNGPEEDDVFFGHSGVPMHYEVADTWYDSPTDVFPLGVMRQITFKHVPDPESAHVEMSANGAFVARANVPLAERKLRTRNFIGLSQYDNCSKFLGGIGEIILYARVLETAEQRAVETYLQGKWRLRQ
jgi:hypothetical protein